jgi:2-polyprenyl-3-methyl-5-hydroxy-6-metoxy-1,4-benzoquinol methylase
LPITKKPQPFEPGEPLFWTDPHIAQQMLASHLDPTVDGASRRPETIERTTSWIASSLGLRPGDCILDLGCGPGLYAERLSQAGFQVTGVDFSQNSIDYALRQAQEKKLPIQYRCQNYLELDDQAQYSAALLIYGDLCPLSPEQRAKLLANVRTALKPNGWFILDVTTPRLRQKYGLKNSWYAAEQGFWKPSRTLSLNRALLIQTIYTSTNTSSSKVTAKSAFTATGFRIIPRKPSGLNWLRQALKSKACGAT